MVSQLNILEVAEYVEDGAGLSLSKGSTSNSSTRTLGAPNPAPTSGLLVSPNLWFGFWTRTKPTWIPDNSIRASSNTLNVPDYISISVNLGNTSGCPLSR